MFSKDEKKTLTEHELKMVWSKTYIKLQYTLMSLDHHQENKSLQIQLKRIKEDIERLERLNNRQYEARRNRV